MTGMGDESRLERYVNSFSRLRLSQKGRDNIKSQFNNYTEKHTDDEFEDLIVQKYFLLCDEIHKRYSRGKKILMLLKIISAVVFVLYSFAAIMITQNGGNKMLWLTVWILLIFLDVGFFMVLDYCSTLFVEKIFPYLDNPEIIDFGIDDDEEAETNREDEEDDF